MKAVAQGAVQEATTAIREAITAIREATEVQAGRNVSQEVALKAATRQVARAATKGVRRVPREQAVVVREATVKKVNPWRIPFNLFY